MEHAQKREQMLCAPGSPESSLVRPQLHLRRLQGPEGPGKRPSPCFGGTMGHCQAVSPSQGSAGKSAFCTPYEGHSEALSFSSHVFPFFGFTFGEQESFRVYTFHAPERSDRLLTHPCPAFSSSLSPLLPAPVFEALSLLPTKPGFES